MPTEPGDAVTVRPVVAADLADVAAVHQRAFPDSAITHLGLEAARRYYRWQLEGPHDAVAVLAERQGEMAGFCFAGVFRGAMSGFLRRERWFLVRRIATHPWLVGRREVRTDLSRGIRSLRPAAGSAPPSTPSQATSRFGVLAIATDPAHQRRGVAAALMAAVEDKAREGGYEELGLTVHVANAPAIAFYEREGWERSGATWNGSMRKALTSPEA